MLYSVHLLRFFAAAIVVVSHTANVLRIPKTHVDVGAIGVDIFFVISGLVIGLSTRDGDFAVNFALKRFIRVVPAYWLATLALIAFLYATNTGPLVGTAPGAPPSWHDIWLSLAFLSPLTPAFFPVVFPGWTLSYEMLFYAIYGLTLALFRKNVSTICMIVVVALVASGAPSLCFEFVLGLGLSALVTRLMRAANMPIGVACLGLAAALLYTVPFGSNEAIAWGFPSLLLIVGVMQFEQFRFLRHRICIVLGDASYAIYLFHILLMSCVREAANAAGIELLNHLLPAYIACFAAAAAGGVGIELFAVGPMTNRLRNLLLKRRERDVYHRAKHQGSATLPV